MLRLVHHKQFAAFAIIGLDNLVKIKFDLRCILTMYKMAVASTSDYQAFWTFLRLKFDSPLRLICTTDDPIELFCVLWTKGIVRPSYLRYGLAYRTKDDSR